MRTWILQRYQVYARVCLTAALFVSPVVFYRNTADVFNLVKITALWVLGIAALGLWVAWSAERGFFLPRIRIGIAAAGFLAVSALATAISENPALSLFGLYHRYGGLIPFTLYAVIMILIVGLYWERPGDLKEVARAAATGSLLMTAYVLIQAAGMDWIKWVDPAGNPPEFPVGTMGNSNFAGGYLGIAIPFLVYLAASARRPAWKTSLGIVVGLSLLATWFTQTRGGMMAGGAGLLTVAFLYRHVLPRLVRATAYLSVGAVVLVAVLVVFHPGSTRPPEPLAEINTFRTGTFTVRTYYWGAALRIFKDNPVLGTGLESYYANYPKYRLAEDGASGGLTITDKPHSIYLEYAANSGILGLGSYLALVGMGLFYGYRRIKILQGEAKLLTACFLGVLVGYLTQGFFSIDVPPLAVMGWVALGGIAAIADPAVGAAREKLREDAELRSGSRKRGGNPKGKAPANPDRPVGRRRPARWWVHGSVALAVVFLITMGVRPILADFKTKTGQTKEFEDAAEEAVLLYKQAIRIFPLEPAYHALVGAKAEQQAGAATDFEKKRVLLSEALGRYRQALRLQPGNIFYLLNIARVYTNWAETIEPGRFAEADRWWRRAVSHDPTDWVVHHQYALMLNSWANAARDPNLRRRTADQLETVARMRPDLIEVWINLARTYQVLGEIQQAQAAARRASNLDPDNQDARAILESLNTDSAGN